MKKIVSVIMIITIFTSILMAVVPVSHAATENTQPVAGNTATPLGNTAQTGNTTNNQTVTGNTTKSGNNTVSTSASVVPAKGLEPEETTPVASTSIPETGLTNMVVIAIVVVSLVGVGSFIRAKSIKID